MASESTQHKLDRVRAPRVQITYDVEIGDAIQQKELPFVLGVVGDFSGKPEEPLPALKLRKFTAIDRDNFDEVLKGMKPRLQFRAPYTLSEEDGKTLPVELNFKSLDDFRPEQVVQQVEPLRKLLEIRTRLSDLRNKMGGNEKLEEELQAIIHDTEKLQRLGKELGHTSAESQTATEEPSA